jgi:hypothetical protein
VIIVIWFQHPGLFEAHDLLLCDGVLRMTSEVVTVNGPSLAWCIRIDAHLLYKIQRGHRTRALQLPRQPRITSQTGKVC